MSYILSALKKAEQERGGASPLAASLLAAEPERERRGAAARWLAGILLVAAAVAVAIWFLVRPAGPQQNLVPVATPAATPATPGSGVIPAEAPAPRSMSPAITPRMTESLPAVSRSAVAPPAMPSTAAAAVYGAEIPAQALVAVAAGGTASGADTGSATLTIDTDPSSPALPELEISGHIYVEARPAASKLFAAGGAWREGDTLPGGVVVRSIEAEAVVLQYLGREYRVAVK